MAVPAIHPGEHIVEELKVLDMGEAVFAGRLKVPANRITAILSGQVPVTQDVALRLAHHFGTSAEFWLNLQKLYEMRIAEKVGDETTFHQGTATGADWSRRRK